MYGTHAGLTYAGVGLAVALVIALSFVASPLFAVMIAVFAIAGMIVVRMLRRRSVEVQEPEAAQAPATPEGRAKSPTGSRSGGAPVSGEG